MLYLIRRLENPIWRDRHTHTHISANRHVPLLIMCESEQYKGRTVIVSPLLALKMALSCILAIHIRNMAHKDTRYRSKTQVINAVIESFLTLAVIVIRRVTVPL